VFDLAVRCRWRVTFRSAEPGQDANGTVGGGAFFGKPQERKFDERIYRREGSALIDGISRPLSRMIRSESLKMR